MRGSARFWRRWDIAPDEQAAAAFDVGLAAVNVRRVELACLLAMMSDSIELAIRLRVSSMWVELVGACVFLVLSWGVRRWPSRHFQMAFVLIFLVAGLASTGWTLAQLTEHTGRVFSGYLTRVLTLTLLFILPPVMLSLVLAGAFAGYWAVLNALSLPAFDRSGAIASAGIVTVISVVAGWLIYAARRSDHDQKLLIRAQNGRLAAQNAELDQLMAITAHDLRSPLLGLRNLFDLATRRADSEPLLPLRVMRDGISGLDAMLTLVTRLLDAHQAEHAALNATVHEDLRGHVLAAGKRIAPLAEASAIHVDIGLASQPLCARFDAGALAQILDNLLANAVRYSRPDAPIRLSAQIVGDRAVLAVEDRGPGIDAALQTRLFGKFHRGSATTPSAKAGTGMGLFIASTFASRIGATLSYRDAVPNGSIFELSLPVDRR